jgi:hypothetical protein
MEDSASGGVARSGVIAPLDDLVRDSPGPFALPPISTTVRMPGARRASGDSGAGAGGGGSGTAGDNADIKSDRRPSRTWAGAGTAAGEAQSPQTLPPLAGRASAVGPTSSKMPSDIPLSPTSPSVLLGRAVLGASGAHGGRSDRVSTCACWGRGGARGGAGGGASKCGIFLFNLLLSTQMCVPFPPAPCTDYHPLDRLTSTCSSPMLAQEAI